MRTLIEAILQVFPCASDDAMRPQLQSVMIDVRNSRVRVWSTNAHILAVRYVDDPELVLLIGTDVYAVPPHAAAQLKLVIKCLGHSPNLLHEKVATGILVGFPDSVQVLLQPATLKTIDVDRVIPAASAERVTVALDAEYLLRLAKAIKLSDKRAKAHVTLSFSLTHSQSPILVTTATGERVNFGVLMPIRK